MEDVPGVISAVSGFTGGHVANPTYRQTVTSDTGHVEAVRRASSIRRGSATRQLVRRFLRTIDPTDSGGQFCDRGPNYHTAIFAIGDGAAARGAGGGGGGEPAIGRPGRDAGAARRAASTAPRPSIRIMRGAIPSATPPIAAAAARDAALRRVWGG